MTELQATYTVNTGPGESVEMTGPPDVLDKITMQMRTHGDLLKACELALTNFQELLQPTHNHLSAMARLRAAIKAVAE